MHTPSQWDIKPLKHHHFLLTLDDSEHAPLSPGEYLLVTTDNLSLYCPLFLVNQKRGQTIVYHNSMTHTDIQEHLSLAKIERIEHHMPHFAQKKPLLIFCQQHVFAQVIFYLQQHRHTHEKIILIGEVTRPLPFTLLPSQLLLPQNPIPSMMGSIQLLEDWSVCARFCGLQNAGYAECTISQMLDQWPDIIHSDSLPNILLAGNQAFINTCQQKLLLTNEHFLSYHLEV